MSNQSFETWLLRNGRHPNTVSKHLLRLKVINRSVPEWNVERLDEFIVGLKKQGKTNATLNYYIDTIRVYSRFANIPELNNYKHFKKNSAVKGTLSDDEIEAFLNLACPVGSYSEVWDTWTFFFYLLAYTGARPAEIANLSRNDFDFGNGTLLLSKTKTGRPRRCPTPPKTQKFLEMPHLVLNMGYIFTTSRGQKFSDHSWGHAFEKRIKLLGINRPHVTPYSFRHSFATKLLEEDVNIHKVAKILGHDIRMTAQYEHLTTKDLLEAVRKHPLIRKGTEPKNILREISSTIRKLQLDRDERFEYEIVETEDGINFSLKVR